MKSPTERTPKESRPSVRRARRGAAIAAFLLSLLFNYWTVATTRTDLSLTKQHGDYYNLLVDGFQSGQLAMKATPHPDLLALPPQERPGKAPYLLDASLYEGRYYLYFGVVPAALLYWPYTELTGHDLPEGVAVQVLAVLALVFGIAWWREVRRRFFPDLAPIWEFLAVLALGFCTAVPPALRHPMFYEVAILSGWACGALMLWASMRAARDPRSWSPWVLVAGIAYGLAVGSRANLAPAGLLALLAGMAALAWQRESTGRARATRWLRLASLAGVGAAAIGAGLAAYNYARFGSIVEFGHSYQLGHNPVQMFRLTNLAHNFDLYYLTPPQLRAYFPFVAPGPEAPKPVDYIGLEEAHGQWPWWIALLAVGAVCATSWRRIPGRALLWALLPVATWGVVNLVITGLTGVRSNRYMLDFHPALVWLTLAGLGAASLTTGAGRRALRVIAGIGIVGTALFNVLVSLQVHGWLLEKSPVVFAQWAKRADGAVARVAPALFRGVGDRLVEITWPAVDATGRWPVMSAGVVGQDDGVWIDSAGGGRVRFAFQHWEYAHAEGPWFEVTPGGKSTVRIGGAFLLPPEHHAWYGSRSADERLTLKRRLRIAVDGVLRFDRDVPSHSASPWEVASGKWTREFSRHTYPFAIGPARVAAVDDGWVVERLQRRGTLRLRLRLPVDRFGVVEPLLQSGQFPQCDWVTIRYTRPGHLQLLHDCHGAGGFAGPEFEVDYAREQVVEIETPAANDGWSWTERDRLDSDPSWKLCVRWNGREVLRSPLKMHSATEATLAVGANFVRATSSRALFAGEVALTPGLGCLRAVQQGRLEAAFDPNSILLGTKGILAAWPREGLRVAALLWRREMPGGPVTLGWLDEGTVTWSAHPLAPGVAPLAVQLPQRGVEAGAAGRAKGLVEVEQGGRVVLSASTEHFIEGPVQMVALAASRWSGEWADEGGAEPELPGRLRLRFALPATGLTGSEPLFCAGRPGAADLLYLRRVGAGQYVLGLDHWGYGGKESEPFALAGGEVHTLVIEIGALFPAGEMPTDHVRLVVNDRVVLHTQQAFYPVSPQNWMIGRNPHGMSTSVAEFRGSIFSIRKRTPEAER